MAQKHINIEFKDRDYMSKKRKHHWIPTSDMELPKYEIINGEMTVADGLSEEALMFIIKGYLSCPSIKPIELIIREMPKTNKESITDAWGKQIAEFEDDGK